jgi:hypothetical protein
MSSRRREPPSKTDVLLFKQLANPDRVDIPNSVSNLLRDTGVNRNQGPQSAFDRLTQKYTKNKHRKDDDSDDDSDDSGSDSDSEDEDDIFKKHKSGKIRNPGSVGFGGPGTLPGAGPGFQQSGPVGAGFNLPQPVFDPVADRAQRQFYMNELIAMQRQGYQLSIALDESTPTYVLKTEYDLVQENQAAVQGVSNLRAGLQMSMRFIEMGNQKINSPLPLNGWTDNTFEENPSGFDRSLRRIYNMYWRNSFNHPMVELGMALCFSAAGYMMRNTTSRMGQTDFDLQSPMAPPMGGSGALNRPMPQVQRPAPAPQQFQRPQHPQQTQFNPGPRNPPTPPVQESGRRTLRPPFSARPGQGPQGSQNQSNTPTAGPGMPVPGTIPLS